MTRTLIIGAGITGAATAHLLAGKGHDVEIVEISAELRVLGSGITLISPALRALGHLGVLEECMAHGYGVSDFTCLDIDGKELFTFPLPALGENMPGIVGMMRPALHRILLDHAFGEWLALSFRPPPQAALHRSPRDVAGIRDRAARFADHTQQLVGVGEPKFFSNSRLFLSNHPSSRPPGDVLQDIADVDQLAMRCLDRGSRAGGNPRRRDRLECVHVTQPTTGFL